MRTNVVAGETADGAHYCVYIGQSVDEALAAYAQLRAAGGWWTPARPTGLAKIRFARALCTIDPRTSKHCSFPV